MSESGRPSWRKVDSNGAAAPFDTTVGKAPGPTRRSTARSGAAPVTSVGATQVPPTRASVRASAPTSNMAASVAGSGSAKAGSGSGGRGSGAGGSAGGSGGKGNGGDGAPKKKKSWWKRIGLTLLIIILALIIVGCGAFLWLYMRTDVPAPDQFAQAQTTKVYYNDGETELGSFSEVNRTIIDPATLPDYVGNTIVASEDRTFYTNNGIDLKGIARALVNNVTGGSRQGGSTLSQQYVENYYVGELTDDYMGKLREAILALKINREQDKAEILGNYMNTIYFGRGAYGIEAASQAYYGIPAAEMSLSQAAMIAGIIPSPGYWDPAFDEEQAKSRWQRVLDLMVEDGWASQAEVDAAVFPETLPIEDTSSSMTGVTGYLMQQVRNEILEDDSSIDADQLDAGGLKIITTLDHDKQLAAEASVQVMPEDTPADVRIALSSIDNATGEILAEYPGKDYQTIQSNAVTQDVSAAGSTFKPFGLLTYIEQGGSIYDKFDGNSPQTFAGASVGNNDGYSFGMIDMVTATKFSVNTAYMNLNEEVGAENTWKTLVDAGIPSNTYGLEENMANILGSASTHNIDLAAAYSTLANGGKKVTPHIVRQVQSSTGKVLLEGDTSQKTVFSAESVSALLPALESVVDEGGTGENVVALDRSMGGKTGTSDEQKSAQFAGFIPQMTTVVSMYGVDEEGNPVSLPNIGGLSQFHGSDWPVEMWMSYMEVATQGLDNVGFDWLVEVVQTSKQTYAPTTEPTTEPTQQPTSTPTPTQTTEAPKPEPTEEPEPTPTEPDPDPEPTDPPQSN